MPHVNENNGIESFETKTYHDEATFMEFMFMAMRKWKIIAISVAIGVIVGLAMTISKPDIYESEVTLMVSGDQAYSADMLEMDDISRNQRLVATYTEIARSDSIMLNVIENLDLDITPDEISSLVNMTTIEDTELIKVTYRDRNPQKSAMLVNEVSEEFIKKISEVMSFQNLKIVEKARIPTKPVPYNKVVIFVICIILGGIFGILLAYTSENLYGRIRKPEDIEKVMESQILANLPKYYDTKRGE